MTKLNSLLCFVFVLLAAHVRGAAFLEGSGGGGAPGSVTVPAGADLAAYNFASSNVYQLGRGTYAVPGSLLMSNLNRSTPFTGILRSNLTTVSFIGVPGQTIWSTRASFGDLALFLQCTNLYFYGITFLGYTNHDISLLPHYDGNTNNGDYLGAIVNLAACDNVVFENCTFDGSWDHGLIDFASNHSGYPYATIFSTRVYVRDCSFYDIGGWRLTSGNASWDGTALETTAWTCERLRIENCLRAWEPYNEMETGSDGRFYNATLRDSFIKNMAVAGALTAGNTNAVNAIITGNTFVNEVGWTYHGSNYTAVDNLAAIDWRQSAGLVANNNSIRGHWGAGVYCYGLTHGEVKNNTIKHITNTVAGGVAIGVYLHGTTNVVASGNIITEPETYGMYLYGAKSSVVENNSITLPGLGTGILIATFGGLTASNNFIRNNYIQASTYGIEDQLGNLLPQYLFGNEIVAPTKIRNQSGDNLMVEGPPRVFNFTNDFPSIAAGGSFRTNFPAVGSRTNDFGFVMTPDQFYRLGTNIFVQGWASNDTFWIWVQNTGPAAADAVSVRFKASVRQVEAY